MVQNAMKIDSSGNVSIGTTNSTLARLYVSNDTGDVDDNGLYVYSNIGQTVPLVRIIQDGAGSTGEALYVRNDGSGNAITVDDGSLGNTVFVINSSGNVGIGTTSPSTHKLQVTGDFTGASAGAALFQNTHSTVASGDEVVRIQFSGDNDATGGHFVNFYDSGGDIGRINVASASTTQYATTSDYRLKENIIDLEMQ
jgi:hypothetical protein